MAEVLGGIGETIDTTKFNGIQGSDEKELNIVAIKIEDTEEEEEEEEENNADQEDSSPSDYECSLREENIRLKSRLEQAKEGRSTLEKQCKKAKEELEKEKKFGDKANSTIYSLMQEKQSLIEKMKRAPPPPPVSSVHHEGIQEVVRKLEHEIQVLEERLDSQRKRYHQEHLVMYEDLKEERSKRQEWKQTYLKSQLAVMTFRRKLNSMKDRVSEEDIKELSKCLELVFHEQDGRLKQDLISKSEEACVEGQSKYAAHINSTYKSTKESPRVNELPEIPPTTPMSDKMEELKDYTSTRIPPNQGASLKHTIIEEERNELSTPKVFIMDDENELHDPSLVNVENTKSKDDLNVKLPPMASNSTSHVYNTSLRYELAGNKHHNHSLPTSQQQQQQRQSQDSSPQYKHWHHYSIDNPGHNPGRKLENILAGRTERVPNSGEAGMPSNKKSLVSTLQRLEDASYKSKFSKYNHGYNDQLELNVNDTKFLELNFDRTFMKTDFTNAVPSKLPKLLQQKNGIRNEVVNKKFDEKKLYCLTCDKDVLNRACGHTTIIVQEKEREFPCPTCARVFTNRSHLKRHNMIHSGEKPFACTYCDKRFNRKSHLSRHLLTHTGEKPFKCPTCDKGFADNSDLKRHKQIHEVSPNLVPILPKDPKEFQTNLVNTVNSVTQITSVNNITNTISPTASLQPTSIPLSIPLSVPLNIPKIAIAPIAVRPLGSLSLKKEARYPCTKCGKQFSRKSHLTRHKLTHDQVKIYCDCGRLFRQNAHYQAHYPACKRKRDEIEKKYLSDGTPILMIEPRPLHDDGTPVLRIEPRPDPALTASNTAATSTDSYSLLSVPVSTVDSSNIISNIKSVNDFRAHLAAKFNEGANFIDTKPLETGITKQSLNEKQIKEEQMEYYNETQQINFTEEIFHQDDSTSENPTNVLNEQFTQKVPNEMPPPREVHQRVQYSTDRSVNLLNQRITETRASEPMLTEEAHLAEQYSTSESSPNLLNQQEKVACERIQAQDVHRAEQHSNYENSAVKIPREVVLKQEVVEVHVEEKYSGSKNSVKLLNQHFTKTISNEVMPTNEVRLAVQYSTSANLLNQHFSQKSELMPTQRRGNNEQLYVVPSDVLANQYLHKTNIEQKLAAYKMKEDTVNEQNDERIGIQKMSDINFNIIVKNGSSKLPTDDLALGSASLPSLPAEVPPLLNE